MEKTVGAIAGELRRKANLTALEVAKLLGLSVADLTAREQGSVRFSASQLFILALRFNVDVSRFFEDADGSLIL